MKYPGILFTLITLVFSPSAFSEEELLSPEQVQYLKQLQSINDSLQRKTGDIELPNKVATLKVPDSFYYLNPQDTRKVLVDLWGNPPGGNDQTLGMLFPSNASPLDHDAWGVTIEYEEDGYVSDEDADDIDYDDLLADLKQETENASKQRVQQGYEAIELIGWAAKPYYDKNTHKLHWAKEIKFGDSEPHTLNYNIRVLGRKGVLVLNFIASMDQKALIDSRIDTVLALAEFNQGSQYADFDPSIDKVAAYGIGALVAGKVIAKTGLIAAALIFMKKFGIILLVGAGVLLRKLFGKKTA